MSSMHRSAVLMFVHGKDKVPDIQFEQEVDAGTHTFVSDIYHLSYCIGFI